MGHKDMTASLCAHVPRCALGVTQLRFVIPPSQTIALEVFSFHLLKG